MGIAQYGQTAYGKTVSGGVNVPDLEGALTYVDENITKTETRNDTVKQFKVNDEKPEFSDVLRFADGTDTAIDLTNADNVKIRYEDPDGNVKEDTVTISGASNGKVEYQFDTDEIDQEGLWRYEYLVTFTDGTEVTVPNGNEYNSITVGERL